MNRYLTAYEVESDTLYAFTEAEAQETQHPEEWASDWVWQYATDRETAKAQHFDKMDEWELDPEKDTY